MTDCYITGLPDNNEEAANQQIVPVNEESKEFDKPTEQKSDDADGVDDGQFYEVDQAEPPTNYDDAYSDLPPKIKLNNIKVSSFIHQVSQRFLRIFYLLLERYYIERDLLRQ